VHALGRWRDFADRTLDGTHGLGIMPIQVARSGAEWGGEADEAVRPSPWVVNEGQRRAAA